MSHWHRKPKKISLKPLVAGFVNNGTPALAVTDRVTSGGESVNIYDSVTGSSIASVSWADVANLYALDFDHARIVQINPTTYAETGVPYSLPSSFNPNPSTYSAFGQALLVANDGSSDALYGVFIFYDASVYPPNYASSLIVKFTIPTGGTNIYTAAVGGGQSATPNSTSAIQQIDLTSWPTVVNTPMDGSTYGTDFYDISVDPASGDIYVLSGLYNSGFTSFTPLLQKTDSSFGLFTTIDNTAQAGFLWSAQYTPENDRIWYTNGKFDRSLQRLEHRFKGHSRLWVRHYGVESGFDL